MTPSLVLLRVHPGTLSTDALDECLDVLQIALELAGLLLPGRVPASWQAGCALRVLTLSHPDALNPAQLPPDAHRALAALTDAGARLTWQTLADGVSTQTPPPSRLTLYWGMLWEGPPLVDPGGRPVPLHHLDLPLSLRAQLIQWSYAAAAHDRVYIGSGTLEAGAYRELADPDSQLAREGLRLCRAVEQACGIPTELMLLRADALPEGEDDVPCPGCGAPWEPATGPLHLRLRCCACRLTSTRGDMVGEPFNLDNID